MDRVTGLSQGAAGEQMRLICPNCGAQYEVPESVIPESGRDVQCSSCGTTWFQHHPLNADAAEDEAGFDEIEPEWDDDGPTQDDRDDQDDDGRFETETVTDGDTATAPQRADDPADDFDDDNFTAADNVADSATEDADDEWQGFPSDPGLSDAPQNDNRLVPDPEDRASPVSRLPEVEEDDYEEDPARDLPMPRRSLDTSVADMLREEAEREARARAAERGATLESQPDLGLDSGPATPPPAAPPPVPPQRADETRHHREEIAARTARPLGGQEGSAAPHPAGDDVPPQGIAAPRNAPPSRDPVSDGQKMAAAAAAVADSRRALLPDIEEINSSLRSTSDRRPARADDHERPGAGPDSGLSPTARQKGFGRGFSVTLLIAMILLALYVFAPTIVEAMPGLAPAMEAYVSVVDRLRIALDAQVQNLSRWLAEIAGNTG